MRDRTSLLAIGIDAAEPSFARQLMDDGQLPVLRRLAAESEWRTVSSPAHLGSGAVWPTFMTATGPERHGIYAEWAWRPQRMAVERYSGAALQPFWTAWAAQGRGVGVLDVPFAPIVGVPDGFEIKEWGPHDAFDGHMSAHPRDVAERVRTVTPHPFYADPVDPAGPEDTSALLALAAACNRGAALRGDLAASLIRDRRPAAAIVVFPEVHHASHYLWHGVEPDAAVYRGRRLPATNDARRALVDVWRTVDAQVGRLIADAGDPPTVAVFSLHGMRPATGIAALLADVLAHAGVARYAEWRSQDWRSLAASAFAAVKRHSPAVLKRLYYRTMPPTTTRRLAQTTMLPAYDWSKTRAFALPSDQHGWVRINLRGREARGIVDPADYDRTCEEISTLLRSLRDEEDRPLVQTVLRTAGDAAAARETALPDLVAHWEDAALAAPVRVRHPRVASAGIGRKFTGQHAFAGFCLWRSDRPLDGPGPVEATALSRAFNGAIVDAK